MSYKRHHTREAPWLRLAHLPLKAQSFHFTARLSAAAYVQRDGRIAGKKKKTTLGHTHIGKKHTLICGDQSLHLSKSLEDGADVNTRIRVSWLFQWDGGPAVGYILKHAAAVCINTVHQWCSFILVWWSTESETSSYMFSLSKLSRFVIFIVLQMCLLCGFVERHAAAKSKLHRSAGRQGQ